jgi:hypothetical protein
LFLFYSLNLNADGLYAIAKYGLSSSDNSVKNNGSPSIDNDSEGFMVTLGTQLGTNWGTEVMYYDLGETSITGNIGDSFKIDEASFVFDTKGTIKNNTTGYGTGIRFISSSDTEGFEFYGKTGVHVWDKSGSTTLLYHADNGVNSRFYNDGVDLYFGFGFNYNLYSSLVLNVSYDALDFSDTGLGFSQIGSLISLGLKFDF